MPRDQLAKAAGASLLVAGGFVSRRAFAQATTDTLAGQLNDLTLVGVAVCALLVILIGLGAAIFGRQR